MRFRFSFRWIPEKAPAGQIYASLQYGLTDDLWVGIDYRPKVDEVELNGNWRALDETANRPALTFGTAVDDFDETTSRHWFAALSKNVGEYGGVHVSPFVGATYIVELEEVDAVAGLHLRRDDFSALVQYTGVNTHLTVSYGFGGSHSISFILFDLEKPGLAYSFAW